MVQASGEMLCEAWFQVWLFLQLLWAAAGKMGTTLGGLTSRPIAKVQQGALGDHTDAKVLRLGGFSYAFLGAIFSPQSLSSSPPWQGRGRNPRSPFCPVSPSENTEALFLL